MSLPQAIIITTFPYSLPQASTLYHRQMCLYTTGNHHVTDPPLLPAYRRLPVSDMWHVALPHALPHVTDNTIDFTACVYYLSFLLALTTCLYHLSLPLVFTDHSELCTCSCGRREDPYRIFCIRT